MFYLKCKKWILSALATAFGIISWIDIYCMFTGIKMFTNHSWKFLVANAVTCIICAFLASHIGVKIEKIQQDFDKWYNEGTH